VSCSVTKLDDAGCKSAQTRPYLRPTSCCCYGCFQLLLFLLLALLSAELAEYYQVRLVTLAAGCGRCLIICRRWCPPGLWRLRSTAGQKAGRWPPRQ
jgi:hypothetical protein